MISRIWPSESHPGVTSNWAAFTPVSRRAGNRSVNTCASAASTSRSGNGAGSGCGRSWIESPGGRRSDSSNSTSPYKRAQKKAINRDLEEAGGLGKRGVLFRSRQGGGLRLRPLLDRIAGRPPIGFEQFDEPI